MLFELPGLQNLLFTFSLPTPGPFSTPLCSYFYFWRSLWWLCKLKAGRHRGPFLTPSFFQFKWRVWGHISLCIWYTLCSKHLHSTCPPTAGDVSSTVGPLWPLLFCILPLTSNSHRDAFFYRNSDIEFSHMFNSSKSIFVKKKNISTAWYCLGVVD